jgi:large subunit ribosomal protein L22
LAVPADTPTVRAVAKWVRISPRKARLVTEHIRGRTVPEARTILAFTPRAAAREIEKVLRSAVANAEANHGLIGDELYITTAIVDEGVTLKRWRPQARGRAHQIRKRTCHITVALSPLDGAALEEAPRRRRRGQAAVPESEAPVAGTVAEEVEEAAEPEESGDLETAPEAETATEPGAEAEPKAESEVEPEAEAELEAEAEAESEPEAKPKRRRRSRKTETGEEGEES